MTNSEVDQVKQKTDIVAVIGERVNLKKSGRNFKGLCPFHGEKSPSFFVSPEMQLYKCFGCGVSGDVLSFVQSFEGLTFPEALRQLAEKAGVTLSQTYRTNEDNQRERWLEILNLAAEYYHYLLMEHKVGEKAREYLKSRGVYVDSQRQYRIGYALDSWDGLRRYLGRKKGYTDKELEAVGLVIKGNQGYYDRFRGRIMFPLTDNQGKVVGFSGRVLDPTVKEAKYINSPETPLYHKSELLFGLSAHKRYIREKDRVIVVEGEMDVIGSYQAGVKEVVAVKGSALTDAQVLQLRRLTGTVILALDADEAGQEAIKRGIEVAEKQGVNLRVIQIKEGKDPAELSHKDPALWKEMVKQTVSVYQFFIDSAFAKYDAGSGTGQKQISQFLAPILAKIQNAVEQAYYLKKVADQLGVAERVVEEEVQKAKQGVISTTVEALPEAKAEYDRREKLERLVASLLLQAPQVIKAAEELRTDWFKETYLKQLVEAVKTEWSRNHRSLKAMWQKLPEPLQKQAQQLYVSDVGLLERSEAEISEAFEKAVVDLKKVWQRDRLNELTKEMARFEGSEVELEQLRDEYRQLSQLMAAN